MLHIDNVKYIGVEKYLVVLLFFCYCFINIEKMKHF